MNTVFAADLFCGAGGTSSGLRDACDDLGLHLNLTAVNHWVTAVKTHTENHPDAAHFCQDISLIDPLKAVPGGKLELLVASPECTHHSNARGGKPMSDQSRSSAWDIPKWAQKIDIKNILIENVREFESWGPLDETGRPDKARKGETFQAFITVLRSMGYTVDYRVLNAADYGDATTRQRLFVQARKGVSKIIWPKATHFPAASVADELLSNPLALPWKPARDIIDWSVKGKSIYNRKRPLAPNTYRRILSGLIKYSGLPFFAGCGGPTGSGRPQPVTQPLGAILTDDHRALVSPWLVVLQNNRDGLDINDPVGTILAGGSHYGLCDSHIVPIGEGADVIPANDFMLMYYGNSNAGSLDEPCPAITADSEHLAIARPCLVVYHGEREGEHGRTADLDRPFPALDTSNRIGLVESCLRPFLFPYYGNSNCASVHNPLHTVTARDHFAIVSPEFVHLLDKGQVIGYLDIFLRMLTPRELAAAMSYDRYTFLGNRGDQVRQIGNGVPRKLAKALCMEILRSSRQTS